MSAPRFRLITFDLYTALADLPASLVPRLERALQASARADPTPPRSGSGAGPSGPASLAGGPAPTVRRDARELLGLWRRKQMEYALIDNALAGARRSFRELTRAGLDYALAQFHIGMKEADRAGLVDAWNRLELWPEARAVVAAAGERGVPIAVLSNGDCAMLAALVAHAGLAFDHLFSAEEAGAYKPDRAVYRLPLEALGLRPHEVLHVAGSATDTMGAKHAGLACFWSNRGGESIPFSELRPDYEVADLAPLLDVI